MLSIFPDGRLFTLMDFSLRTTKLLILLDQLLHFMGRPGSSAPGGRLCWRGKTAKNNGKLNDFVSRYPHSSRAARFLTRVSAHGLATNYRSVCFFPRFTCGFTLTTNYNLCNFVLLLQLQLVHTDSHKHTHTNTRMNVNTV